MRVSQVLISSGFGGAERLFVDICNGMAMRGHKILAICPEDFQGISLLDVGPDICIEAVNSHWDRNPFAEMKLEKAYFLLIQKLFIHIPAAHSLTYRSCVKRAFQADNRKYS